MKKNEKKIRKWANPIPNQGCAVFGKHPLGLIYRIGSLYTTLVSADQVTDTLVWVLGWPVVLVLSFKFLYSFLFYLFAFLNFEF
jgi:hypothetical protein